MSRFIQLPGGDYVPADSITRLYTHDWNTNVPFAPVPMPHIGVEFTSREKMMIPYTDMDQAKEGLEKLVSELNSLNADSK